MPYYTRPWTYKRQPVVWLLSVVIGTAVACSARGAQPTPQSPPLAVTGTPAGIPSFVPADDGQWTMAAKDLASTRFSALDEINGGNVSRLKVAWTFSTGLVSGHEAPPLVVNGTMYVVTPFPNFVFALDLSKPGAPVKWRFDPKPLAAAKGVACCDLVNRGAVFWNGLVIFNTLDGRTIGLDANTGDPKWVTQLADIDRGETITMAPIVADGTVLVGDSGGEFGVRGWITGLDAASGQIKWRAYNTGPDADVLIGPSFKPFYAGDRGKNLGVSSWPGDAWKLGGGTVWGWISYDPDLHLLYHGTANPGPWNPDQRPGDNKWTAGIFARDPATGEAHWFYQWTPHDLYDHDGINENVLVDLTIDGRPRKVLLRPERNGYLYVMDRTSGEVLSATPFVHITSSTGVDLQTGRLQPVPEKAPHMGVVVRDICPASPGAKDWQPSAYSPRTGFLYIPHNNLCMDYEGVEANYIAGTPYVGANVVFRPGPGGNQGVMSAWDPVGKREVWNVPEKYPAWSGTVVTAGDLVFYGTMDGWFKALDARSGAVLWQFKTGSGVIGQPIAYRGPDGHEYIAVFCGVGGWPGAVVVNDLDTRDETAAAGWGVTMRSLPQDTSRGGMLYVFTVDGR